MLTNPQPGMSVYMKVEIVSFATSKILIVKSTVIPRRSIHKYTSNSPDGKPTIRLITS